MIGWSFPSNGGGLICGIAEAGIQTFTGKEISSLARETCQNSLDAAVNFPVAVSFQRHEIYTKDIPGVDEYKIILSKCREFWRSNEKAKIFLDKAIQRLSLRPKSFVLQISDFNTSGLSEPFNPRAQTGWNTLTKIDGGATKTGDAAGSFGIGKNAPFTNSFWRMIFYRTLNTNGEHAAQGMARLPSFALDAKNISAGVGYFGETQGLMPVTTLAALDNISARKQIGTDIFIYGFNGSATWQDEIFIELLENFLVAIHRGKLRCSVNGLDLSAETLGTFVSKYGDNLRGANDYHKVLSGDAVKIFEEDFHGMGTFKLSVLHDQKAALNRKVLVVRSTGMKLFELDRLPRTISFTAILELQGRKLNEFFREMETPAHDSWEPGRYEKNPALAKKYLTELKRRVREIISALDDENIEDEVNVEGLSDMLNFDDGAIDGGNLAEVETLENHAEDSDTWQKIPSAVDGKKNNFTTNDGAENSRVQRVRGDISENGDNPAIRTLKGTRTRKTLATHAGEKNPDGDDIILEPAGQNVECRKVRVIKVGKKSYRLILNAAKKISRGHIEIFAIGEDNNGEKLPVASANSIGGNVKISGDKISFSDLNGETKINFDLQDEKNYTLGVAVYED